MENNSLKNLIKKIKSDLPRYHLSFFRAYMTVPGFNYTTNHRICYYLSQKWYLKPLWFLQWLKMKHKTYYYGIQTAWTFDLPEDFVIAHFGNITFFPESCGEHIYLRQGVTVGNSGKGNPHIGNNVEFGANSIVVGPIKIGNNVIIGAGSVVTKDVPDNCVVAGVPAKIIKYRDEPSKS